jgi:hypothetical protein
MRALLFTSLLAISAATAPAETRTFSGVITDSMCVKDHAHMNAGPDADCAKACVRSSNGKYKYVLFDGAKSYRLSDQETPGKFAATKVNVTGTLYEKTGVIKVDKIEKAH